MYYLYIIECSNDSLYVGYTHNIVRRYETHCKGTSSCKYTRSFPPKRLAVFWQLEVEKGEMLRLEKRIKQLTHMQKRVLTRKPKQLNQYTTLTFEVGKVIK